MLEFDDIRIGNKVLHTISGKTVTILKIEENRILLQTFPADTYVSNKDITGIVLTTSILQKLGFTNDMEVNTWKGEGIHIRLKQDGFFYGLRNFKKTQMQYLHQLQNYIADFYALFREQRYSLDLSSLY